MSVFTGPFQAVEAAMEERDPGHLASWWECLRGMEEALNEKGRGEGALSLAMPAGTYLWYGLKRSSVLARPPGRTGEACVALARLLGAGECEDGESLWGVKLAN